MDTKETKSIIVYHNPLEKDLWEGNIYVPYPVLVFMIAILSFIALSIRCWPRAFWRKKKNRSICGR